MEDRSRERKIAPEVSAQDRAEWMSLDTKIKAMLPPQYENSYESVQPISMGSASLKFGPDGKVAWDEIWTSFCELALAGGPPHRGTLLEPVATEEVHESPKLYQTVVEEIARGIWSVTQLPVLPHIAPGWVGVRCATDAMASWLVAAIVVENVIARRERNVLYLPAGPHFQLAKEIKNVVTVMAKTYHYWSFHRSPNCSTEEPVAAAELLEPALPAEARGWPNEYKRVVGEMEEGIRQETGLPIVASSHVGWIGVECANVKMAVWLMRAVVVENVIVRREQNVLYLPASPKFVRDDKARKVVAAFARACRLWWCIGRLT